jgi:hypothetical protein
MCELKGVQGSLMGLCKERFPSRCITKGMYQRDDGKMAIWSLLRLEHYPMVILAAPVISPAFFPAPCPKTKATAAFARTNESHASLLLSCHP